MVNEALTNSSLLKMTFGYLLILIPVFLPLILIYVWWVIRFRWVTMKYVADQKTCLLEIKLPKEITKSPAAMEIFFSHLNHGGAGNYSEAFLEGKVRPWFSFEIVSTDGYVRFFVWSSQAKFKNMIETQLYAQYPNIEIFEVKDDYTKDFYFDLDKYSPYALQFKLTKADPYPIKTYIDYGLDEDQKDEYKIDPITSVIEFLGSLKKGENAWIQILIQRHEQESWFHGTLAMDNDPKEANFIQKIMISIFGSSKNLKAEVAAEIKKIREKAIPETKDEKVMKFPNPTKGDMDVIAALERSATKTAYDCMVRAIYFPEKDAFKGYNIAGIIGCFKQYGSANLNGFKPGLLSDVPDWKKDWATIFPFYGKKLDNDILEIKKGLFHAYKLRSFFQLPYKNFKKTKPFILTTEELATIWHFPSGMVSQTPTLQRVGSKKSEAPSNLPI